MFNATVFICLYQEQPFNINHCKLTILLKSDLSQQNLQCTIHQSLLHTQHITSQIALVVFPSKKIEPLGRNQDIPTNWQKAVRTSVVLFLMVNQGLAHAIDSTKLQVLNVVYYDFTNTKNCTCTHSVCLCLGQKTTIPQVDITFSKF